MSDSSENDRLKNLLLFWPERAIKYLYEDYYDNLIRVSERKVHDRKAAEDIVQEAFADVWENRGQLTQHESLFVVPYLFTVVRNKSINFYKRSLWLHESLIKYRNGHQFNHGLLREPDLISAEDDKPIWRIIATFPPKEKECLTLKHKENMSNDEIAKHLNISKKAVERSVTSAYKRLRKYEANDLRKGAF